MSDSRNELARKVYSLTVNEKIELLSAVGSSSDVVEQQLTATLLQIIRNPADSRNSAVFTSKLMDICNRRLLYHNLQNFHSYVPQPVTLQEPIRNEGSSSEATAPRQLGNQSMFASEPLSFPYMHLSQHRPTIFPPPPYITSQNPQFSLSSSCQPDGNIRNLMLRPQLPNYTTNIPPAPPAQALNITCSLIPFPHKVDFKTNPFYENKIQLLPPTRLRTTNELTLPQDVSCNRHFRECSFTFSLKPNICSMISQYLLQPELNELNIGHHHIVIQMGKFNENSEFYEQVMPLNLQIRVNQNYVQLPLLRRHEFQSRHICKYVVITDKIQLTPGATNSVAINWVPEMDEIFCFDICFGRIIPYNIVFRDILITNCINWIVSLLRVIDLIKHQTEQDGVGRRTVRVSLNCPFSGQRMRYPGIGKLCFHLQMFDVENYIQMNETYNSWTCPICQRCTPLSDLEIYEYIWFGVIRTNHLPSNCNEIEFNVDGSWIAIVSSMQQSSTMENIGFSDDNENSTTEDIERSDESEMSTEGDNRFSDEDETPEDNNRFSDGSEMSTEENNRFSDEDETLGDNNRFSDEDEAPGDNNRFSDGSEMSTEEYNRFSDDDENPTVNDNGLSDDNTEFRNMGNAEFTTSGISNNNYFNLESEILNSNVKSVPVIIDVINLTNDE